MHIVLMLLTYIAFDFLTACHSSRRPNIVNAWKSFHNITLVGGKIICVLAHMA